ncbi:MAG: panthothenate synthetase [Deltaproteobacteria bacterium]|nr:panthothenate synthetase [Deltaproteobacteria bacterium]
MRMLVKATMPVETFNNAVRDGSAGPKLGRIIEDLKPEATYFIEEGGKRTALLVVSITDPSQVPSLAEPWFLSFNATVELHPAMTPEDLRKAGLAQLGKKYTR